MSDPIERLEGALRRLGEDQQPPAGWQDRVKAAIQPAIQTQAKPRRWWWVALPALAAAAVVLVLWLRPRPQFELDLAIETPASETKRGDVGATVGDTLHISAAGATVWLYRDDRLVVAFSNPDASYKLDAAGTYEIVALTSERPIPAPTGSLDADVAAAIQAGATEHRRTLTVR